MSNKPETSVAKDEVKAPMSLDALARRRALLSGLGKGGAVLAAAVPIQSMAGSSTPLACKIQGNQWWPASVSGANSAVHSIVSGGGVTPTQACGKKVAYWCKGTGWPCSTGKTFYSCFGVNPPGGTGSTTLLQCLNKTGGVTDADCPNWCAAYLNGLSMYLSGSGVFPYPHDTTNGVNGVKAWYTHTDKAKAIALFKTLENLDS